MREKLMNAMKLAYHANHVADAIEAAIHAAYRNNPQHGYDAAIAVFEGADRATKEAAAVTAAGGEPSAELLAVILGAAPAPAELSAEAGQEESGEQAGGGEKEED